MQQSSVIFAALLIGFVVYITAKGRLPQYVALLFAKSVFNLTGSATKITPDSQYHPYVAPDGTITDAPIAGPFGPGGVM